MQAAPQHRAQVFGSPWPGVYGTHIDSARHFERHWHAVYGLGLVEAGAQRSASGRGPVAAYAGDLIASNPGEVHDGQPLDGATRRWRMVYLEPSVLASMGADPLNANTACAELMRPVFQNPALRLALSRLLTLLQHWDAVMQTTTADALACEESLVAVCAPLHAQSTMGATFGVADAAAHSTVGIELQHLREQLADDPLSPPTLTDMAVTAGMSKFQLLRRFEKAFGLTPFAWVLQQRAERARRSIRAGNRLADAAADSGFADQSHMTRIFARQFGFTPGALRKVSRA